MQTISNIQEGLRQKFELFADFVKQESEQKFTEMPNGKWSSGQHLEHLIRSTQPVLLALRLPKFVLRWVFGKANRPSRTYLELVSRYQERLAKGGTASGRFVPPLLKLEQKNNKLEQFLILQTRLAKTVGTWSETELDSHILPHPLLGKLTMREMLFFTAYHTEHHLEILKGRG